MFTRAMGSVVYTVGLVWVFYMALEPYVRRVWPETVISWSRMLAGRWIDPLVGRDVLIGAAAGTVITLLGTLDHAMPGWLGMRVPMPSIISAMQMLESATDFSTLFSGAIQALYSGLLMLLFLVLLRMALRRKSLVALAFIAIFVGATGRWSSGDWLSWIVQGATAVVFLTLLVRHGLVAMIFCLMTRTLLTDFPVTFDFSVWYRSTAMVAIGATVIILLISAYAALGGRPFITLRLPEA